MEIVTAAFDDGNSVDLIYVDFSKAFDKVPHKNLTGTLDRTTIASQLLVWIKKWLTGRRQRVVIDGRSSGWADVESGVQGSSLGPILFTIFINDIDDKVSNLIYIIKKLADDTKLGHKVNTKDDRKALQIGLALLLKWTMDWGMQFNIPKCKALHVGRNNHNFKYYINKIELQNVNEKET